ncbi:MAG TPA: 2,3,4,5-tetrahydropyridine-2,6-dicarboxylate N-succinyltransferase [Candidatus Megaira endosymbiont of Nemacystus decipiens]|nr:2,3,4,5-tetrahydropyridine-2,6-dicarboxylate N-succinyltransferase [Candidatus Megaera endosymbiont of Nemacystus decipiens]
MEQYVTLIDKIWEQRSSLEKNSPEFMDAKSLTTKIVELLDQGKIEVCSYNSRKWIVNEWVKKAILLHMKLSENKLYDGQHTKWYDKISPKFHSENQEQLINSGSRVVPGAYIRQGSYIGNNTVIMPSFINIGAYVDEGTLVDTWATVGSCARVGKNCHISGGAGIGGVLEPIQASPVIIEDNCFIGARSEIAEGVIVEKGAVIAMGVFLGASTKIVNRQSGEITYGKVPAYSVVVPGVLPSKNPDLPGLACAVIIKQVDEKTRSKTSINELLRN